MDLEQAARAEEAARRARSLVCVNMPHLSGLAHHVRISGDDRIETAGVFASGRLLINPRWFLELNDAARTFVLAHELMHLALYTHLRVGAADPAKFNLAHDLIINDMLESELGMRTPAGGVRRPGARALSVESLMLEPSPQSQQERPETAMAAAIRDALHLEELLEVPESKPQDVLNDQLEAEWFPDQTPKARAAAVEETQRHAVKTVAIQVVQNSAREFLESMVWGWGYGHDGYTQSAYVDALDISYQPLWQLALHRWLDAVTTPKRTYTRASRRGADRTDVVLPGRHRETQTISIVLDTSGSMTGEIAHALGLIMAFGRGAENVRIVQCDATVTRDDVIPIDDVATYPITGFGGSDMTAAMTHLADDADTTAVTVITDGDIGYPRLPMPYHVLWVVYGRGGKETRFDPGYGEVIRTNVNAV